MRFGLIATGGLVLATGAFCNATGNVLALRNPARALRFDSGNAPALAGEATLVLAGKHTARQSGADLARAALRYGPISAPGLRAVAIASAIANEAGRSEAQFRLAQALSRRDLPTQLALIESCVARSDVACALVHYDVALTTSTDNAAPLFPILSAALTDPGIVRSIAPYVRRGRPWGMAFMAYAADQAEPSAAAAVVIAADGLPTDPLNGESEGVIFGRLAAAGRWDTIRRMYAAVEGPRATTSHVLGFTPRTVDPHRVPVAWQIVSSGSAAANFDAAQGDASALRLDVSGSTTGETAVARRLLFLPAGARQALTIRIGKADMPPNGVIGMALSCLAEGAVTGTDLATWRRSALRPGNYVWQFAVPSTCPAQELALSVKGDGDQVDRTVTIERIVSSPVGQQEGR